MQAQELDFALVPKNMNNPFFDQARDGCKKAEAESAGKFKCDYIGPGEHGGGEEQVQVVLDLIARGVDGIAVSPSNAAAMGKALEKAKEANIPVLTWDSDVNPECRSYYINQGTSEQLGALLVQMAADQMEDPSAPKKVAFHYSSPTVTDQNQWAEVAKRIIAEKYPSWEVVATEFSNQDAQKAVQVCAALGQPCD